MSRNLPNGIGESLGDGLVVNSPLFISGSVLHVDNTNSDAADSAGYGLIKDKPLLTLSQAITDATAGDIIVLHDGHEETVATTTGLDVNKRLLIVGAGQSGGKPTVKLSADNITGAALTLSTAGTELRNIWFEEDPTAGNAFEDWVDITATGCRIVDCYFEANGDNEDVLVNIATGLITQITGCTFVSTSTDVTDQPVGAIDLAGGTLWMDNCVFDAGTVGWSSGPYRDSAAATLVAEAITVTGGGTFTVTETSGNYVLSLSSATETAEIVEQ